MSWFLDLFRPRIRLPRDVRTKVPRKARKAAAQPLAAQYGIELKDVRLKRINYRKDVQLAVFELVWKPANMIQTTIPGMSSSASAEPSV